jgi:hypothetical protein
MKANLRSSGVQPARKVLLINPQDDPEKGSWADLHFDSIVDLGLGGVSSYARWAQKFRASVNRLSSWHNGFDDFCRIRTLLAMGCGRLVDEHGLDWWEIMSVHLTEELEALLLLQRFSESVHGCGEVYVSRPGLHARLLEYFLRKRVHVFTPPRNVQNKGLRHYTQIFRKLSPRQALDVFWDKHDAGYQFRGRFVKSRRHLDRPVVLLPTAYINVSRTGLAYAETAPQQNFLVVTTRRNGWIKNLPDNVQGAWLSGYASVRDRRREHMELDARWRSLSKELAEVPEFRVLRDLGYLDGLSTRIRRGIELRDAWRNVLDREPVQAVLCADDCNPYTSIPLLLARERGLPNIACHHGALDGQYVYKQSYADTILAKGRMEKDYLVRCCGVPAERVEIGAPAWPAGAGARSQIKNARSTKHILFISEAFDVTGGRTEEFYRDVLPPLGDLAVSTGRKLIVKLHPIENKRERAAIISRVLSPRQKSAAQIVDGPLTDDLLENAWFGITVLSTVATECALRGIPCFLCRWLESSPYGYVEQLVRYGVGTGLNEPGEIPKIPEYLARLAGSPDASANCWRPITPIRLAELLASSLKPCCSIATGT